MEINFSQKLKTLDGDVLKEKDNEITLSLVCMNALMQPDDNATGVEKVARYSLAMKIKDGGKIDLDSEDIVSLKELVGKGFTTLVVGQAYNMLESKK